MIQSRASITVRYAETDMMGIVYHANYLPWFEVVLEVSAKYLRPALYDDTLTIVATIREKPLLRIRIDYEVLRGEERLAIGQTAHAFCDLRGQPTRPPPLFAARMNTLFS